ncbi:MAG: hypothetical protein Q7U51_15625, partial [Methanoregula sp.]|nr:hypothetical protein [Methanoregula sp.]
LSMEDKWKRVIEAEGFSYEQYSRGFFRFIIPAVSTVEGALLFTYDGTANPSSTLLFSMDPVTIEHPKKKRSAENLQKK